MTPDPPWDAWRRWHSAAAEGWATALRTAAGVGPAGAAGPEAAGALYAAFAEAVRGFAGPGGADRDAARDLEAARRAFELFGARAFAATVQPGWTAAAGAAPPPPPGWETPALGPFREHRQRADALAAAIAAFADAQQRLAALLVEAGTRAAQAFLASCTDVAARGPRELFDRWIECAESEWQSVAHGEAWCAAQARAFDAALAVRARQQAIADDAARLAGLPTRVEVDDLQRRLRDLERGRRA